VGWLKPQALSSHVWHSHNATYEGITYLSQNEEPSDCLAAARSYEAGEHCSISGDWGRWRPGDGWKNWGL